MAASASAQKSKPKANSKGVSTSKTSILTLDNLSNSQAKQRFHSLLTPPAFSSSLASTSKQSPSSVSPSCGTSHESKNTTPRHTFAKPLTPSSTKGKDREVISLLDDDETTPGRPALQQTHLWVDLYQPTNLDELAVHKRKVQDVRQWLSESVEGGISRSLRKQRRILILSGPAGTGKTATIKVLGKELGFEILEWRLDGEERWDPTNGIDYESLSDKLDNFLSRSSAYGSVLTPSVSHQFPSTSQNSTSSQPPPPTPLVAPSGSTKYRMILLEDLPNISHPQTQSAFHDALARYVESKSTIGTPLIIILSDEGRGGADLGVTNSSRGDTRVDIRSVLSKHLLGSKYVTEIKFNPISQTLLKKALQSLLSRAHPNAFGSQKSEKEILDKVAQNAQGDIRSAIMSLEFTCGGGKLHTSGASRKKRLKDSKTGRSMLEQVTQRENSLALFHLLGKVFYNKRKGDPSSTSASAKEIQKEKEAEALLPDPPPLPSWFQSEFRRTSKVNPETLYSDSPIDTSLYSLYLHQNYPQFCDTEEQASSLCDWLSHIDSMGGASADSYMWTTHINPYQFYLVTLGTLHSLPSPVPRRSQKMLKPSFFDWNSQRNDAAEAADEVVVWLDSLRSTVSDDSGPVSTWGRREIVCDTGAVLKARWLAGDESLPASFIRFADLPFASSSHGVGGGDELDSEGGEDVLASPATQEPMKRSRTSEMVDSQSWLQEDDIEESDS